jgi:hypothetical protein
MLKFCTVCVKAALLPVKLRSFAYAAVMVWLSADAGNTAVHVAVAVPAPVPTKTGTTGAAWQPAAGVHKPVDVNLKVPEGKTGPICAGITVAVNVTVWVATLGDKEDTTVAVVALAITCCGNTGDVAAGKLGSPLYVAVTG